MTHCIMMDIKVKDWEDIEQIWNSLAQGECDNESPMVFYKLIKRNHYGRCMDMGGLCPFLYFPENKADKEEEYYSFSVHTGSHCSWCDTEEILFVWLFWFYLVQELNALGIDFQYKITEDSENNHYSLAQAWGKILEEGEELKKETNQR